MLKGFRTFILRGNVVDLAVAVIIGAAFGSVVTAFVSDILTPLIAAIAGKPNFKSLYFTVNHSQFLYGDVIDALLSFVLVAAAIYAFVILPMNSIAARRAAGADPTDKTCPECQSTIPIAATRCAYCTVELPATS